MIFHCGLNDRKCPQISRTLLSILADINNALVWIVSTRPLISKSSHLFINTSVTVPRVSIKICINFTVMLIRFFYFLTRSRYLPFFSFSCNFTWWSAETAKSTILQVRFYLFIYLFLLIIIRSGGLANIR